MRKKLYSCLLFLSFFLGWNAHSMAERLFNVFTNEEIEYSSHSEDIVSKQDFIKGKFSFDYFKVKTEKGYYINSINEQVVAICKDYINKEEKLVGIYKEVVSRVTNYHKMEKRRNEVDDEYDSDEDTYDDKISLELEDMEALPVSYVANYLFFNIRFTFELANDYSGEGTFDYYVYFKADLNTGVITEVKNTISEENKKKLEMILAPKINKNYELVTSKLIKEDYDLLYYEKGVKSKLTKDVSKFVKMEEAVFYWVGWGMVVSFQNYTESSLLYSGYSFSVFLPLEEAKPVAALLPEFRFVENLYTPGTALRDFSFNELPGKRMNLYGRTIKDLVPFINSKEHPKSLTIEMYQIIKDTVKNWRGKQVLQFDKTGQLIQITSYSQNGKVYREETFEFDKQGKKTACFKESRDGEDKEGEFYYYDTNGNLIEMDDVSGSDTEFAYYFYNGNYAYSLEQEWFNEGNREEVKQVYYDGKELRNGTTNYLLDENGLIKGITSNKYVGYQTQIGYDKKDRIVEVHRDRDRYHDYYFYDDHDRLYKTQNYEFQKLNNEGKYSFEGTFPFPKSYLDTRTSGGNNTILLDEYKWEFF